MLSDQDIRNLEVLIENGAQLYYQSGDSPYTDEEFDNMVEVLRANRPESPLLRIGWGYDVWKDNTGGKFPHLYGVAGSLEKAYNWHEIHENLKYTTIHVSLKLDGLSCVMYFQRGVMYRALTRGDGTIGIDITDKIRYILGSDRLIDTTFTGAVRGEILMSYQNFSEFKKIHPEAKHPRNTATGLIGTKSWSKDDMRFLNVVVYTVVGYEQASTTIFENMSCMIDWLHSNFKDVAPYTELKLNESNVDNQLSEIFTGFNVNCNLDIPSPLYPADGLVLTSGLHYDPVTHGIRYDSQAFKFPAEETSTTVLDVEWNLSKTRYLIPKVHVDTIDLDGTMIQYATGYNAKYIQENKIGPGSKVTIARCGEVIPNIIHVLSSSDTFDIPSTCPKCGEPLEWEGVHLKCCNEACDNAKLQDLLVWLDHICPVDNFGNKLKLKFLHKFYGDDLSIENIMEHRKKIERNPIFGTHYNLFYTAMEKLYTSRIKLVDALLALNVPRLGDITSSKLAAYPDWVKQIYEVAEYNASENTLSGLSNVIGEANADSIIRNIKKFRRLKYILDRIEYTSETSKGKVAITGKLSVKRSVWETELRNHGFEPVSSVTKDTLCLITDDPTSSSSKNAAASKYGIPKLSESQFRSKYFN